MVVDIPDHHEKQVTASLYLLVSLFGIVLLLLLLLNFHVSLECIIIAKIIVVALLSLQMKVLCYVQRDWFIGCCEFDLAQRPMVQSCKEMVLEYEA
ncbi:unnamed protein product [Vicia faba]|uniref:Transmembrane protein n=1 Tax=Vicia faba TaxID=3906 RepID=A0AAV1A379_VICFA|nr:unnamed protein product [Vicia faba]